jgi:hypothetical protein
VAVEAIDPMKDKKTSADTLIFRQPWWLDAVAPGAWGEVAVEKGGELAARMPFVRIKRAGLVTLGMPPLTQTLGPWLRPSAGKYATRLAVEKGMMTELIEKLPEHDRFAQSFHFSITNWLPFYWRGFEQTTRYTYRLEDLTDPDKIWSEFAENVRRAVRKAEKAVSVSEDMSVQEFIELNDQTFSRQGIKSPYPAGLVKRIDAACAEHAARKIFVARDGRGRTHAAVYIIWDEDSAYNLMLGSDPEIRGSGASSLVMWEAIKFAATVTKSFDFEGSMIESVERSFRSYGARQVPYFHVSRMSRRMRLLRAGREIFR